MDIRLYFLTFLFFLGCVTEAEGVGCYQCNIYVQGRQNVCGQQERRVLNCTGCMKTYARGYMHDGWLRYKYTSAVTKYCIRFRQAGAPEGCYTTEADAGYIRQCFCYTDWCNTASAVTSYTLLPVSLWIAIRVLLH